MWWGKDATLASCVWALSAQIGYIWNVAETIVHRVHIYSYLKCADRETSHEPFFWVGRECLVKVFATTLLIALWKQLGECRATKIVKQFLTSLEKTTHLEDIIKSVRALLCEGFFLHYMFLFLAKYLKKKTYSSTCFKLVHQISAAFM